jgi:copper(I)-binding protein
MHLEAIGGAGFERLLGRARAGLALRPALMLALMLSMILTVGAGALPARGADTAALVVEAADAWVRWLPADLPAAGYVTLTNKGPTTLELVGASSPDYEEVSMHQTLESQGMSEMRPVASLVLKPLATVRFAEGGYHLMLMHAKRQLHPRDRVEIVFRFSDGRTMPVPFEVRSGSGG